MHPAGNMNNVGVFIQKIITTIAIGLSGGPPLILRPFEMIFFKPFLPEAKTILIPV
jgi:hypothetical protein